MFRQSGNGWWLVLPIALLLSIGGCEFKCEADTNDDVRDVVEETGDEIEEFSEEVREEMQPDEGNP